ncbi:MAG: transglutaminase domain-containing protein, partial [Actinomycetia bacterium]|nr:transglutaminase domain-containing protein [Actinomycetes bacterium]
MLTNYAVEDTVVPQVADLARSITVDAPTTYDKIRSIEDWMDANINYTREIERLEPGADAVHHLLFESRQGFCEQIGSAMVVMLRSLGIPARLVVGYVPGSYEASSGRWISRGTDAHAWAEVYFPGVGWQGFDPTAGVPLASTESSSGLVPNWLLMASAAGGLLVVSAIGVRRRLSHRSTGVGLAPSASGAVVAL